MSKHRQSLFVVLLTFFVAIPAMLTGVNACGVVDEAAADGDDLQKLIKQLEQMPDRDKKRAFRHTANRTAADHFRGQEGDKFGTVVCEDTEAVESTGVDDPTPRLWTFPWKVSDLLRCLDEDLMENTYKECERRLLADARKRFVGEVGPSTPNCKWIGRPVHFMETPAEWDPDKLEMSDNVRVIMEAHEPPPWMATAVIITAAGVAVLLLPFLMPALCALSEGPDWSCPGNPSYPEEEPTTSSATGGGDQ